MHNEDSDTTHNHPPAAPPPRHPGERVIALTSGGLDSTVLLYDLLAQGYDALPTFVDYGQHCVRAEREALRAVLPAELRDRMHEVDMRSVFAGSSSRLLQAADLWADDVRADDLILPYRNVAILACGVASAAARGATALFTAFINSNHAREIDATASFLDGVEALMAGAGAVRVEMPYRFASKADVVRRGAALGAPLDITYSCQAAAEVPCGACPNCVDRLEALRTLRGVVA